MSHALGNDECKKKFIRLIKNIIQDIQSTDMNYMIQCMYNMSATDFVKIFNNIHNEQQRNEQQNEELEIPQANLFLTRSNIEVSILTKSSPTNIVYDANVIMAPHQFPKS